MLQDFLSRLALAEAAFINESIILKNWVANDHLGKESHEIVVFLWMEYGVMRRIPLTEGTISRGMRIPRTNLFIFEEAGNQTLVQLLMPPYGGLASVIPSWLRLAPRSSQGAAVLI